MAGHDGLGGSDEPGLHGDRATAAGAGGFGAGHFGTGNREVCMGVARATIGKVPVPPADLPARATVAP